MQQSKDRLDSEECDIWQFKTGGDQTTSKSSDLVNSSSRSLEKFSSWQADFWASVQDLQQRKVNSFLEDFDVEQLKQKLIACHDGSLEAQLKAVYEAYGKS